MSNWHSPCLPESIQFFPGDHCIEQTGERGKLGEKRRRCEVDEPNSGDLIQVQIITYLENLSFFSLGTSLSLSIHDMGTIRNPTL